MLGSGSQVLAAGKGRSGVGCWAFGGKDMGKRWLGSKLGAGKEAGTECWVGWLVEVQ